MNQPQPAAETKPAMVRPWLLIVLIIIILVGGGYFAWYYLMGPGKAAPSTTSTTNPTTSTTNSTVSTADWKTYTNMTYGYSFKYPSDWTINANNSREITLNSPQSIKDQSKCSGIGEGPYCENDITFFYFDAIKDLVNDQTITNLDDFIAKSSALTDAKKITFAGKPAYEGTEGGISAWYNIYIVNSNHIYEIHFGKVASKSEVNSIEQQILSTFQFTK
jgi:hypothetical protein